jgi:hypothetical protein
LVATASQQVTWHTPDRSPTVKLKLLFPFTETSSPTWSKWCAAGHTDQPYSSGRPLWQQSHLAYLSIGSIPKDKSWQIIHPDIFRYIPSGKLT